MTILDAYAVLALLKGEPAAADVQALIEASDAALTSIGVAEVLDHLIRVVGASDEDASLDLAQLGLLDPVIVDERTGRAAGLFRARHYHRTRRAVGLADCIAAAVAADTRRPPTRQVGATGKSWSSATVRVRPAAFRRRWWRCR